MSIKSKMPRCAKGTRRNKQTGNCTKNTDNGTTKKRCPKGTRKSRILGKPCATQDEIHIQQFINLHEDMKRIAYAIEEIFYNIHEGMTPKTLKSVKSKVQSGLNRIQANCVKYARMVHISSEIKKSLHDDIEVSQLHKQMIHAIQNSDWNKALDLKKKYVSDVFSYVRHNERVLKESNFEAQPDWISFH